jgi:hypothetical protein
MPSNNYNLVSTSLSYADNALAIFKIGLSPTSLESLAKHITRHTLAMAAAQPEPMDLIGVIVGLLLKQTCGNEVQAFLKAEEAADATQD